MGRARRAVETGTHRRPATAIGAAIALHALLLLCGTSRFAAPPAPPPHDPPEGNESAGLVEVDLVAPTVVAPPAVPHAPEAAAEAHRPSSNDPRSRRVEPTVPPAVGAGSAPTAESARAPESAPAAETTRTPEPTRTPESAPVAESARAPESTPAAPPAVSAGASEYAGLAPVVPMAGAGSLGSRPSWAIAGALPGGGPDVIPLPNGPKPGASAADSDIGGKVLRAAVKKHDKEIGIDSPAAGTAATVVANAVRASQTPGDVRATIDVRIGPDGSVLSVGVVSFTAGDAAAWSRVAVAVSQSLASRKLPIAGAPRGAVVRVVVDSKMAYPSGSKKPLAVAPVCADEMLGPLVDSINAAPGAPLPAADQKRKSKLPCIPTGIKVTGDLADIGAHRSRSVHSSFTVQIPNELKTEDVKKVDARPTYMPPDPTRARRAADVAVPSSE